MDLKGVYQAIVPSFLFDAVFLKFKLDNDGVSGL